VYLKQVLGLGPVELSLLSDKVIVNDKSNNRPLNTDARCYNIMLHVIERSAQCSIVRVHCGTITLLSFAFCEGNVSQNVLDVDGHLCVINHFSDSLTIVCRANAILLLQVISPNGHRSLPLMQSS